MNLKKITLDKAFPYLLIIGGAIALIASFILTYDTLQIAQNPHYVPSCSLNPILSCGSVINAAGDKILGLPYPYYGIAAFGILLSMGFGMIAGAKYKLWYWRAFQIAITLGTIGAYFLLIKSIYKIHALCPFCLSVDAVTTTLFWYTTLSSFEKGVIPQSNKQVGKAYKWARTHHLDLLILWFVIVIGLILKHFWYYYGKHI